MKALRRYRLPELLSAIIDNRGRTCPTSPSGFPLIATNCVRMDNPYPVFDKVRYISDETKSTWFRAHPEPGDILFVCKGTPGRVAVVPDPVPFAIAQDMVALRANWGIVQPRYLYYLLRSPETQAKIANMHVGTMIPHFKKGDFGHLTLDIVEEMRDQLAIAEVLSALDDKIAANTALARTADELVSQTFKASSAKSVPLSSLARFVNGRAFTKGASGTGRVVIRIAELSSGIGGSTIYNDIRVDDDNTARPGDLLFAWSGSLTVQRWFRSEGIVNQHIFRVIPSGLNPNWLLHQAILAKLEDFRGIAADKATTMGHIQRRHLDQEVLVPDASEILRLDALLSPIWQRALAAEQESLILAELRDTLLPQLMSGKLRVKDAEQQVESVV